MTKTEILAGNLYKNIFIIYWWISGFVALIVFLSVVLVNQDNKINQLSENLDSYSKKWSVYKCIDGDCGTGETTAAEIMSALRDLGSKSGYELIPETNEKVYQAAHWDKTENPSFIITGMHKK